MTLWVAGHEWAWRALSPLLDDSAVRMLTLCAMEMRHRALWQFFLYYDDCRPPLRLPLLLHHAIANGCWQAAATIQQELLPRSRASSRRRRIGVSLAAVETLAARDGLAISAAMVSVIRGYDLSPVALPPHVMYEACRLGRLDAVMWLHVASAYHPYYALEAAAKAKQLEIVKWLLRNSSTAQRMDRHAKIRWTLKGKDAEALGIYAWSVRLYDRYDTIFAGAASREHGLLPRKQADNLKSKYPLRDWAAEQGHGDLLHQLSQFRSTQDLVVSTAAARRAAERGHVAVMQWICRHSKLSRSDRSVFFADALINGHLAVASWLHQKYTGKLECTPCVRESSSAAGHDDVVRWIDETFPDVKLISRRHNVKLAATRGDFDEVKRLCGLQGVSISIGTIVAAGTAGHLEIAQWLASHWLDNALQRNPEDFPSNDWGHAVSLAALHGKVDVVRWLVDMKGAWHRRVLQNATMSTNADVVAFVFNHARAHARLNGVQIEDVVDCSINVVALIVMRAHDVIDWLLAHAVNEVMRPRELTSLRFLDTIERYRNEEESTLHTQTEALNVRRPYHWGLVSAQPREMLLQASRRIFLSLPASMILTLPWLPQWAIRTNSHDFLEELVATQHPGVFTAPCLRLLLQSTRNSDRVRWFLDHDAAESLLEAQKTHVVQWAARYVRVDLLQWLLTRHEDLPTLRTAVWTGAKHGHISVLQFVARHVKVHGLTQHTAFIRRVWRSAASIAAEHGHLDVIKWLDSNEVSSLEASEGSLADIAARNGHVHVLVWLSTSAGGEARCSMRGLQCAVGNRHVAVVRWVVQQYPELIAQTSGCVRKEIDALLTRNSHATSSSSS